MVPSGVTGNALIDWYCMFVPSCVSFASCLYILSTYAMFKRIRTPAVNLVMLQTSAEALFCLSHNMAFYNPPETDTDLCRFQGWLINFSLLSSLMFTTSISVYMKATLSRNRREVELNAKNLTTLCVVIFSFASFCASLPFISDQYADLGPKCWIAENEEGRNRKLGVIYRFATHYGIIWALNICLFVCYYEVIKYLRENANQRAARGDDRQIQRTIRILMYYPIISFCVWIPFTGLRLTTAIRADPYLPIEALGFAHAVLSSQGTFYAIAFSQYRTVRTEWRCFFFGGESVSSNSPLTQDQISSDQKKPGPSPIRTSDLTDSEKGFTTTYDVSNIEDLGPGAFSEVEADLELRRTEPKRVDPTGRGSDHLVTV